MSAPAPARNAPARNAPARSASSAPPVVLLVDDEVELSELLAMRLEHHGYKSVCVFTAKEALERFGTGGFDAVLLDLKLPDGDGLSVLTAMRTADPDVPVVMLTAHGTIETAVEATRRGAFGFLTKPFHHHELLQQLGHAVEHAGLRREVAGLRRIVGEPAEGEAAIVGTSAAIARVRNVIERVGPVDVTVLITGESGTGKELAARALHAASPRSKGPFLAVNCAAIPGELLETELFGHVKGAFTGATRDREGLFAAASGGTLFLDEVGDAALNVQSKLLRALQERRYTPVGATAEREADVRVIAATNRDLRADVAAGRFREDLLFRLHVVPVEMPPLRERGSDVALLAEVFIERTAARHGLAAPRLSRGAIEWMLAYSWPGNVRELANMMEAALLLAGADELRAEHLDRLAMARPRMKETQAMSSNTEPTETPTPSAASPSPPRTLSPARGEGPQKHAVMVDPTAGNEWVDVVQSLADPARTMAPLKDARDTFERAYLLEALRRAKGSVSGAARVAGRNRTDFYELLRRHSINWRAE